MALNLSNIIVKFLQQRPGQKFTAREIAVWVLASYPNECREKQSRSTATVNPLDNEAALLRQIAAEIGSQRPRLQQRHPEVKTTESRPRKYYFSETSDRAEIDHAESNEAFPASKVNEVKLKEHDLYPVLAAFLSSELKICSKRIDEKRSSNSGGAGRNKWLHPDLVGMEDLSHDWHREIKDCVQQYADYKTKLWSFEVKVLVNSYNVREAFFQAVSNSSWANFAYLVASEIQGTDTLKELCILTSLHGIGFIRLDTENPSESQIMIPAKERSDVDWDNANRLAEENQDFLDYVKLICKFYQTGKIDQFGWDTVPNRG